MRRTVSASAGSTTSSPATARVPSGGRPRRPGASGEPARRAQSRHNGSPMATLDRRGGTARFHRRPTTRQRGSSRRPTDSRSDSSLGRGHQVSSIDIVGPDGKRLPAGSKAPRDARYRVATAPRMATAERGPSTARSTPICSSRAPSTRRRQVCSPMRAPGAFGSVMSPNSGQPPSRTADRRRRASAASSTATSCQRSAAARSARSARARSRHGWPVSMWPRRPSWSSTASWRRSSGPRSTTD